MVDERTFTRGLAAFFAGVRDVPVGIGDDAAVLDFDGARVTVTCDPVVAGVHFEPTADPVAIGRKAILRNVSDLAAMGAEPAYALVSVLLPRDAAHVRDGVFEGLRSAAVECGVQVVGGDIGTTPGPLTITCTLIGRSTERVLRRDGGEVGDRIHVTGPLGGALLGRHLEPRPRVAEGLWLVERSEVRAAIDVSDGLTLDLATLLIASGLPGAELDEIAIPVHDDAVRAASSDGSTALEHALADGEDYELLFLVRGDSLPADGPLAPCARRPIGRTIDREGIWLRAVDGSARRLEVGGYQHGI
ncbi:MAG: thiamine-phosphate kinase [Planctomycetes bacterium]|nr:thiamine-phosphate kinase [Planctomycetota bacterium]